MERLKQIVSEIGDSECVLVGIGNEWAGPDTPGIEKCEHSKDELLSAYNKIKNMLGDKRYYVITMTFDDLIYEVFDEEDVKVVAPCGTRRLFQCGTHLMTEDEITDRENMLCPVCGKKLVYNNVLAEDYMEEGYLDKFAEYKKFLQSTINKKLVILELGVGMKYPSVIRFAFDKLCTYNFKSKFFRVNNSLPQHIAENNERGISIKADSVDFINMMA